MGHIISGKGVAADPKSDEAMARSKRYQGFERVLRGYYRRFVQNYGKIARPLTLLLRKDGFLWNEEAQKAFELLKSAMAALPILNVPDFSKPFVIETDASNKGLGAVLLQEGRPVAFLNQTLSDRAQKKSV